MCDRDPRRRAAVVAAHPSALGFAQNDEMLDDAAPELLVIATPPSAHLGQIAAAAGRGVQVLCEKPLGLSTEDAQTLTRLAAAHPEVTIATVHQYRFAVPWQWMARAAAGAVAAEEPWTMHVTVERSRTDPLSAGGWRADPEHEGGILGDHAVHYLALLRLLDPGCAVVAAHREGPGGREVATVQVGVGAAGRVTIDLSYAGSGRRNSIRLERPTQCLEMEWIDGRLDIVHGGRASLTRKVASLSDRGCVNALYQPMYEQLVASLGDALWRTEATMHTVGTARLLASALAMARRPAVPSPR